MPIGPACQGGWVRCLGKRLQMGCRNDELAGPALGEPTNDKIAAEGQAAGVQPRAVASAAA